MGLIINVLTFLLKCLIIFFLIILSLFIWVRKKDISIKLGKKRYKELKDRGVKIDYNIYNTQEVENDKSKRNVVVQYFPADNRKENSPFVVICPGGAYIALGENERFPVAMEMNKLGFDAFIINYRVGKDLRNISVYEDVGNAISWILKNKNKFNMKNDNYILCGFSAGGHLVSTFASESVNGYKKYNLSKPNGVIVGYGAFVYNSSNVSWILPKEATNQEKEDLDIFKVIKNNYPKIYFVHGCKDIIIHIDESSRKLDKLLTDLEIEHKYKEYSEMEHGFGIGMDTYAEGWIEEGMKYLTGLQ